MFWKIEWSTLVIVLLFVLMAAVLWTRDRVKINVEALENKSSITPKEAVVKIEKMVNNVKGPLNLPDNHDTIQDIILQYDSWAGFQMLQILTDPDNMVKNLDQFNSLCTFKANLNVALGVLDKA